MKSLVSNIHLGSPPEVLVEKACFVVLSPISTAPDEGGHRTASARTDGVM